jgi:hypothetical protein
MRHWLRYIFGLIAFSMILAGIGVALIVTAPEVASYSVNMR